MKRINIKTGCPYDVIIERGGLKKCGEYISGVIASRRAVIITDDTVAQLYLDDAEASLRSFGFECSSFVFPHGEQSKSIKTLSEIFDYLCEANITRKDFLIALGGGVVGDITGFAAACYLRGIEFVQIPTTLLAQVDSSVGGKTAVDIPGGKNLVGAFKQPALVICDSDTLDTLTDDIFADGMGEVIKYGMIRDRELFGLLEKHDISTVKQVIDDVVYTCIDIKRDVVEHDEFDKGERMILNFGHTLGHAIEGWHEYRGVSHGMGVAAGMCIITEKCAPQLADRLKTCVAAYRLPTGTDIPMRELLPFCSKDKKRESDNLNYIVCPEIGRAEIVRITVDGFSRLMEEK